MELILIMQNLELSSWKFSTEVGFMASAMALFCLILAKICSDSFIHISKMFKKESKEEHEDVIGNKIKITAYAALFLSFATGFVPSFVFIVASLILLLSSVFILYKSSKGSINGVARGFAFLFSYLFIALTLVDYFDIHNAFVFGAFAIISAIPLFLKNIEISKLSKASAVSGVLLALSFSGYSFNTDRVITDPSINDFHSVVAKNLNSGLDSETLSDIYDSEILVTNEEAGEIKVTGLKEHFSAEKINRIYSSQVVSVNDVNYKVTSDNHPTIIHTQARVSTIVMLMMPAILWLFVIALIGYRHKTHYHKPKTEESK